MSDQKSKVQMLKSNKHKLKSNVKSTSKSCELYCSGVFIVNFVYISHLFLMFLLVTWNK